MLSSWKQRVICFLVAGGGRHEKMLLRVQTPSYNMKKFCGFHAH